MATERKRQVENRRTCTKCGRSFRRERGSSRINCFTCSPSRTKVTEPTSASSSSPDIAGPIEASVRSQLEAVGRAETVEGLVAVSVARDIDAGRVTPAQKPGVGQKLAALMAAATAGTAPPTQDALDELAQRRADRAASA